MRSFVPLSPLLRELLVASQLARRPVFANILRTVGLTYLECPVWGIASVVAGTELYQPDESGITAAIVPAFEGSNIVDLVACSFGSRQMRTRRGIAPLLGREWIEDDFLASQPLRVFDNALTWLRGKCRGIVILDWQAAPLLLREVPEFHCQSTATAQRLREAFEQPRPCPSILVPNGVSR